MGFGFWIEGRAERFEIRGCLVRRHRHPHFFALEERFAKLKRAPLRVAAKRGGQPGLALLLLVLHVAANDADDALAAYDLAVFTDPANAAANFHDAISLSIPAARSEANRRLYV